MCGLHEFLGLASYYREFIQGYAVIATNLTQLLRRKGFAWTFEASTAFEALKQALPSVPVLQLADFNRPFGGL